MPLFRALAKNMAPMTNADESPTIRLTLFPIYLSLFIVSTLCSRDDQEVRFTNPNTLISAPDFAFNSTKWRHCSTPCRLNVWQFWFQYVFI